MKNEAPVKVLLCTVRKDKTELATEILNQNGACSIWNAPGVFGGKQETLNLFGLADRDCFVILSIVRKEKAKEVLKLLSTQLELEKGLGFALTIPLGAISQNTLRGFLDTEKQIEEIAKEQDAEKENEKGGEAH